MNGNIVAHVMGSMEAPWKKYVNYSNLQPRWDRLHIKLLLQLYFYQINECAWCKVGV